VVYKSFRGCYGKVQSEDYEGLQVVQEAVTGKCFLQIMVYKSFRMLFREKAP
jgi:hypothetical protein